MLRRLVIAALVLSLIGSVITIPAYAQSLYWNVPTPGVANKGDMNVAVPMYLRPWHTRSGEVASAYVQGVYGIGPIGSLPGSAEIGLNVGPMDLRNIGRSASFADVAMKWYMNLSDPCDTDTLMALGITVGNNASVGLSGRTSGHFRDYAYAALSARFDTTGTRVSAGPYYATRDVFDNHPRFGGQFTFEQPLPFLPGFSFVVDHQTGHNGTLTPGLMWNKDPMTVGVGYNISNNGPKDNMFQILTSATF